MGDTLIGCVSYSSIDAPVGRFVDILYLRAKMENGKPDRGKNGKTPNPTWGQKWHNGKSGKRDRSIRGAIGRFAALPILPLIAPFLTSTRNDFKRLPFPQDAMSGRANESVKGPN